MMKREILFAAKDLNGAWQEGLVTKDYADTWFITNGVDTWQIVPETISQWTGLKDRNDKNIFEFDVLKNKDGSQFTVKYHLASFRLQYPEDDGTETLLPFTKLTPDYVEVIGNLFDTPELIGMEVDNG